MTTPRAVRPVPLLVCDLDSTVRHGFDELGRFVHGPDDVVVFPEAAAQIRAWRDAGGRCVAVTNQAGIGLGYVPEVDIARSVERTVLEVDRLTAWHVPAPLFSGAEPRHAIDCAVYCSHAPDIGCWCRKPATGMVHRAVSWLEEQYPDEVYPPALGLLTGDRPEDARCAAACGLRFLDAVAWRASAPLVTPEWVQGIAGG